jgi:hypothetical protein
MTGAPTPRVVIDADLAFPAHRMTGKRCDYIIFFCDTAESSLAVVPIELKSGGVKASEVYEQLQGGADFATRFTPQTTKTVCFPILFYGNCHRLELAQLKDAEVRFRNEKFRVVMEHCGSRLTQALSKRRTH